MNPIKSIPKIIHYVWMGGAEKSELAVRCINSWKKYMPDYEIIEWNESNFDINSISYTKDAYHQKKWAFVSDAVRTYALKEFGGVYFDTDVELFSAPGNIFAESEVVLGFENKFLLSTGAMATVAHHSIFEQLWNKYETARFINPNNESTINTKLTFIVVDYLNRKRLVNGNHLIRKVKILSDEFFSNRGEMPIFAAHYFNGSWKTKTQLTLFQYFVFAFKFRILGLISHFMGNKRYIEINDELWRVALRKTQLNIRKGRKIYKVL